MEAALWPMEIGKPFCPLLIECLTTGRSPHVKQSCFMLSQAAPAWPTCCDGIVRSWQLLSSAASTGATEAWWMALLWDQSIGTILNEDINTHMRNKTKRYVWYLQIVPCLNEYQMCWGCDRSTKGINILNQRKKFSTELVMWNTSSNSFLLSKSINDNVVKTKSKILHIILLNNKTKESTDFFKNYFKRSGTRQGNGIRILSLLMHIFIYLNGQCICSQINWFTTQMNLELLQ